MDDKTHTGFVRNEDEVPPLYTRNDPIREAAPEQLEDDPRETHRLLSGSMSPSGGRDGNDLLDHNARIQTTSPELESGTSAEPYRSSDYAQAGGQDGGGGQFGTSK